MKFLLWLLTWMGLGLSGLAAAQPQAITVVLDSDYPPYIFRDAQGEFQGILKDSWMLWQKKTGVEVNLMPMDWMAAQNRMRAGQADVIDTMFKTPSRQEVYDFTAPYAEMEVSIFFHHSVSGIVNAESLKGFAVGVKEGDSCIESLASQGVDQFKTYPSYSAVLSAASAGNIRVFCMDQPPGAYLLHQLGLAKDYRQAPAMASGQFHRAVHKGDAFTLALVEQGFASITPAEAQQIQDKWYGSQVRDLGESPIIRWVGWGTSGIVALTALLVLWNLTLHRRVQKKTQVLSNTLTELQQARRDSDEALKRLTGIADRVPGMVYQYLLRPDGSSCFPYVSEAIRDIYRLNPEQVHHDAAAVFSLGHPADVQAAIASIQESARTLSPWKHEYRVRFDDGTVRWLFGDALPERQVDGAVLWHGMVTDITERKAADAKLRQLSSVVEQAPIAVVITDLQGRIEYANPGFTLVTGYAPHEVIGANSSILQSGKTPQKVYADMWQTLARGEVWQGELHNRKKSGDIFVEHAVIAPVLDEQGQATHYVAVKQDITRRKQAEQMLLTSLDEKMALLNEVHHRVKNNLQVITSLLRLEAGRSTEPGTRTVLKDMQGRVYAMALLHETLYRAGNFAWIDLAAYLRQMATQAIRSQGGAGGEVQLLLELAPTQVAMDQATPCGLLANELLSNALKHGFPKGRSGVITLKSQPDVTAGVWRVCVKDNGVGLPADFDERRKHSLGLELVSDLARQLGGHLEVQAPEGGGASFCVVFPLDLPKSFSVLSGVSPG
jgi:PAS domain S-box-containing protein